MEVCLLCLSLSCLINLLYLKEGAFWMGIGISSEEGACLFSSFGQRGSDKLGDPRGNSCQHSGTPTRLQWQRARFAPRDLGGMVLRVFSRSPFGMLWAISRQPAARQQHRMVYRASASKLGLVQPSTPLYLRPSSAFENQQACAITTRRASKGHQPAIRNCIHCQPSKMSSYGPMRYRRRYLGRHSKQSAPTREHNDIFFEVKQSHVRELHLMLTLQTPV